MSVKRVSLLWLAGVACLGCAHSPPPEFKSWTEPAPEYSINPQSDNAFDHFAQAAMVARERNLGTTLAEARGQDASKKKAAEAAMGECQKWLRSARKLPLERPKMYGSLDTMPPYVTEWAQIAQGLLFMSERALEQQQSPPTADIVDFAQFLWQGAAIEADLGLQLLNQFLTLTGRFLNQIPVRVISQIEQSISRAIERQPWTGELAEAEELQMRSRLQDLQDRFRAGKVSNLEKTLGFDAAPGVKALARMSPKDSRAWKPFFDGLGSAMEIELERYKKLRQVSMSKRTKAAEEFDKEARKRKPESDSPLWTLVQPLFWTLRPLPNTHDRALAKAKLFCLEARIRTQVALQGKAPQDLSQMPDFLLDDPISGKPFVYSSVDNTFRLYSEGKDGRDDGGKSDETGEEPDFVLVPR